MFIYNITIKVNNSILKEWMKWQMEEHSPQIMDTNLFYEYKIYRLLEQDEVEATTYIFQYHIEEIKNYQKLYKDFVQKIILLQNLKEIYVS